MYNGSILKQNKIDIYIAIPGLQSFPREREDKDMAAMLDDITKEANEKYLVAASNMAAIFSL
jgi:hypothetical protein